MTDRTGIFAGDDPFFLVSQWLKHAQESKESDANAMALATVDKTGLPNNRIVLLKEIEADSIVFYTNYDSAKGQELTNNPKAAIVLYWKSLCRQIRMRGDISRVDGAQSDAYFSSRFALSRIGAHASPQSQVIANRAELETRVQTAREKYGENPPRPDFWGGFRLHPLELQFWASGDGRLHDCFRWCKTDAGWQIDRLGS